MDAALPPAPAWLPAETPPPLRALAARLVQAQQGHLFADWPDEPGDAETRARKLAMLAQLARLDEAYALDAYAAALRGLVARNAEGALEASGLAPPLNVRRMRFASAEHLRLDALGADALLARTAFVLVAGGLGERLGLPPDRIKLSMPYESTQGWTFLDLFLAHLDAFASARDGRRLSASPAALAHRVELVIMTSDDTHELTLKLMRESPRAARVLASTVSVTVLKQPTVPAILDAQGRIAKASTYLVLEKPHGHGDVHTMLFRSGVLDRWAEAGISHVAFVQDTNPGTFLAIPACLGCCAEGDLEANVFTIPRLAKSASGSIVRLTPPPPAPKAPPGPAPSAAPESKRARSDPTSDPTPDPATPDARDRTVNIEYNVLSNVLRRLYGREDENDAATGFSPYPGNTNQIILRLREYRERLRQTDGRPVKDFVNPKFAEDGVSFLKPTRLESLMQDYLEIVPMDRVGVTLIEDWEGSSTTAHSLYAPAKNALPAAAKLAKGGASDGSAGSSEMAVYGAWAGLLRALGCRVDGPERSTFGGIPLAVFPRVLLRPSAVRVLSDARALFPHPERVHIAARSALVVEGPGTVVVESLELRGALLVRAARADARVVLRRVRERNRGVGFVPVVLAAPGSSSNSAGELDPSLAIRGFRPAPDAAWRVIEATLPGEQLVVCDDDEEGGGGGDGALT